MKKLAVLVVILISQTVLAQNQPVSVISQKWYESTKYQILRDSPPHSASQSRTSGSGSSVGDNSISGVKTAKSFVYEIVIKNETDKKIIGLAWDFVIYAPQEKAEQERKSFVFTEVIKKQRKETLSWRTPSPPSQIINAKDYENKDLQPIEKVEINCVVFEDKTIWKREGVEEKVCQDLLQMVLRGEQFRKK